MTVSRKQKRRKIAVKATSRCCPLTTWGASTFSSSLATATTERTVGRLVSGITMYGESFTTIMVAPLLHWVSSR